MRSAADRLLPPGTAVVSRGGFGVDEFVLQVHLLMSCAVGTLNVWLISRLAARVSTPIAGQVALVVAAGWFNLINLDSTIMSEGLALSGVLLAILLALRHQAERVDAGRRVEGDLSRFHRYRPPVAVGILLGFAAITRADLLLAGAFLCVWAAAVRQPGWCSRAVAALLAMALPIVIVSAVQSSRLDSPVLLSTNSATALAANCDETYSGPSLGAWSYSCLETERGGEMTEIEFSGVLLKNGRAYVAGHLGDLPKVVVVRLGRTFGLYKPFGSDSGVMWGRWLGWGQYVAAILVLVLRRRWLPTPLRSLAVGFALAAAVTTVVTYGNPRFRYLLEPLVVVAVAHALGGSARPKTVGATDIDPGSAAESDQGSGDLRDARGDLRVDTRPT